MSEYPTAYRRDAWKYEVPGDRSPKAFREAIRREIARQHGSAFAEAFLPPETKGPLTRLPPIREPFGKKGLGRLGEEVAAKFLQKQARTIVTKAIPFLGEAMFAKDVYDLGSEIITIFKGEVIPPPAFNPGSDGADWAGWINVDYGDAYWPSDVNGDRTSYPLNPDHNRYWTHPSRGADAFTYGFAQLYTLPADPYTEYMGLQNWSLGVGTVLRTIGFDDYTEGGADKSRSYTTELHIRTDESLQPTTEPRPPTYKPGYMLENEVVTKTMPRMIPGYGKEVAQPSRDPDRDYDRELERDKVTIPSVVTIVGPGTGSSVGIGPHVLAPAPPGTKERKFRATIMGASIVARAMNQFTEAEDAIKALWDTLPKSSRSQYLHIVYRKKDGTLGEYWRPKRIRKKEGGKYIYAKPRLDHMWKDVYDHWDEVNVHEAIENLAKNEIQDNLIGAASKRVTKAARPWYDRSGKPVGFMTGPAL